MLIRALLEQLTLTACTLRFYARTMAVKQKEYRVDDAHEHQPRYEADANSSSCNTCELHEANPASKTALHKRHSNVASAVAVACTASCWSSCSES